MFVLIFFSNNDLFLWADVIIQMDIVKISSKVMWEEITSRLTLPNPIYGIEMHNGGYVRSFVDIMLAQDDNSYEITKI